MSGAMLRNIERQGINILTLKFQLNRKEHQQSGGLLTETTELEHNKYRVSLEISTGWHYICLG